MSLMAAYHWYDSGFFENNEGLAKSKSCSRLKLCRSMSVNFGGLPIHSAGVNTTCNTEILRIDFQPVVSSL